MTEPAAERLPLFPLGLVLFPGMLLPLHLFEERYLRLTEERSGADPIFGVVLTKQGREVGDQPEIHHIGTSARLLGAGRYEDGRYDIVVRGGRRFRVDDGDWTASYFTASVNWLDDVPLAAPAASQVSALSTQVAHAYHQFLAAFEQATGAEVAADELPDDPIDLGYASCARIPLNTWERQELLEEASPGDRLDKLLAILRRERALLEQTGAGGATIDRPGMGFLAN
jgi:Lon protease-like protein